jgi:hypothetical protein
MLELKEKNYNKWVYEQPHNPIGLSICVAIMLAPLCFTLPPLFSYGDRSFTCSRIDKTMVNCEVVFQPLLPLPKQINVYKNVRGARIEKTGEKNKYYVSYVSLITSEGQEEAWVAKNDEALAIVKDIQIFLKTNQNKLLVDTQSQGLWHTIPIIFVSLFVVLVFPGGIGLMFLPLILMRHQVIFDRSINQIQKCYVTPFGVREKQTYSLSDIEQVTVDRVEDSEDSSISFSMKVQDKSQKTLLSIYYGTDEMKARTEAYQLGQFLGCPVVLPETNRM